MEDTEAYAFLVFPSESEVEYPSFIPSSEDLSSSWYQTNFSDVPIPVPSSVPGMVRVFILYSQYEV